MANEFRRFLWLFLATVLLAGGAELSAGTPACTDPAGTTVYLVRHAEKGAGEDPGLTEEGQARAEALAHTLAELHLDGIHVTELRRTGDTAAPTARTHGLEPVVHSVVGLDLEAHVQAIAEAVQREHCGGSALVVGHSNTIPAIVTALSGRPQAPMTEADYDGFFQVRLRPDRPSDVLLTHYGAPHRAEPDEGR